MKLQPTNKLRLVKSREGDLAGAYSVYGHFTLEQWWEPKPSGVVGEQVKGGKWKPVEIVEDAA